jgi:hypothetical protein
MVKLEKIVNMPSERQMFNSILKEEFNRFARKHNLYSFYYEQTWEPLGDVMDHHMPFQSFFVKNKWYNFRREVAYMPGSLIFADECSDSKSTDLEIKIIDMSVLSVFKTFGKKYEAQNLGKVKILIPSN